MQSNSESASLPSTDAPAVTSSPVETQSNSSPHPKKSIQRRIFNGLGRLIKTGNAFKPNQDKAIATNSHKEQTAAEPEEAKRAAVERIDSVVSTENSSQPTADSTVLLDATTSASIHTNASVLITPPPDPTASNPTQAATEPAGTKEIAINKERLFAPPITHPGSTTISAYFSLQTMDSLLTNKKAVTSALFLFLIGSAVIVSLTYGMAACPLLASWLAPLTTGELLGITVAAGVVAGLSALTLCGSAYASFFAYQSPKMTIPAVFDPAFNPLYN